jgi:6-pyruvoyltetrahydropterin/6-carboxytetrahydropterin synthase
MKISLTRTFSAAHCLHDDGLSPEQNERYFGKCEKMHGHTWKVCVEVEGNVDHQSGMVVNFNTLKELIDRFDHGIVNAIVPLPTAEHLVMYFMKELKSMELFSFVKVRVYESENAYAEKEWLAQ